MQIDQRKGKKSANKKSDLRTLFVVAGEASADRLAGSVIEALGGGWRVIGMGGDCVRAAGGGDVKHRAEAVSVMGLVEVLPSLPRILGVARRLLAEVEEESPDVALLVDLPDFNMRLGPILSRRGIPVVYLGAPQAWAWRAGRADGMAEWVDSLACLFPFEPEFFEARGVTASFVGHPRAIEAARLRGGEEGEGIALLPGSRGSELRRHLPLLRSVIPRLARRYPQRRCVLPVAPTLSREAVIRGLGSAAACVEVVERDALEVLADSAVALVASGTAVTECVLMGVPAVVFYRVHPISYALARRWIRVEHIAMANILAGERLVPELVQDDATPDRLLSAVEGWLDDPEARGEVRGRLRSLAASLEGPAGDSRTPAGRVVELPNAAIAAREGL